MGKIAHNSASVKRFFLNTFAENPMQEAIDISLGKHVNQGYSKDLESHVKKGLSAGLQGMTETEEISISVASWSMGGKRTLIDKLDL